MTNYGYFLYIGLTVCVLLIIVCAALFSKYSHCKRNHITLFSILCGVCCVCCIALGISALSMTAPQSEHKSEFSQSYLFENDTLLYYTPKGTSYHFTKECRYIANSKQILCGNLEDALLHGAGRPCSGCVKTVYSPY